jgi:hypothetical protein
VAETAARRLLCCGFRRPGKAMGQVYPCWWRGYVEKLVFIFFQVQISHILRFISICDPFTDSPSCQVQSLVFKFNFVPFTDFPLLFVYVLSRLSNGELGLRPLQNHSSLNTPPSTLMLCEENGSFYFEASVTSISKH